jgi:hypothetical protein
MVAQPNMTSILEGLSVQAEIRPEWLWIGLFLRYVKNI